MFAYIIIDLCALSIVEWALVPQSPQWFKEHVIALKNLKPFFLFITALHLILWCAETFTQQLISHV